MPRSLPALPAFALALAVLSTPRIAPAGDPCPTDNLRPSGTIAGTMKSAGFIVGARWGEGVLTLKDGTRHRFSAKGAKVLDTGVAETRFSGTVYNLDRLDDFAGPYGGVGGGLTLAEGSAAALMNNERCVFLKVVGESRGVRLSAPAPGGVIIALEE
jgi:hypothetical protein